MSKVHTFPEHVYFALAREQRLIKIGATTDIMRRVGQLGASGPTPIRLSLLGWVKNGGYPLERMLHQYFASARAHGEWFRADAITEKTVDVALEKAVAYWAQRGRTVEWKLSVYGHGQWVVDMVTGGNPNVHVIRGGHRHE